MFPAAAGTSRPWASTNAAAPRRGEDRDPQPAPRRRERRGRDGQHRPLLRGHGDDEQRDGEPRAPAAGGQHGQHRGRAGEEVLRVAVEQRLVGERAARAEHDHERPAAAAGAPRLAAEDRAEPGEQDAGRAPP